MADGVHQMRLALPRRGLKIEWIEQRRFRRGHPLCGGQRQHIALRRHEIVKGVARVEGTILRFGKLALAGRGKLVRGPEPVDLGAIGARADGEGPDAWHHALPGQRKPVQIMIAHPFGGKVGRQQQFQRAFFLIEIPQLDGPDPLPEYLCAHIPAQSPGYRLPGLSQLVPVRSVTHDRH